MAPQYLRVVARIRAPRWHAQRVLHSLDHVIVRVRDLDAFDRRCGRRITPDRSRLVIEGDFVRVIGVAG